VADRAYSIPLPGLDCDEQTGRAVEALWDRLLVPLQESEGFMRLKAQWAGLRQTESVQLIGARDTETFEARRLRQSVVMLPDDVLTLIGSLANMSRKASRQPRAPEGFGSKEDAEVALHEGRAAVAMTALPGWKVLSTVLGIFAWGSAWMLRHCAVADAKVYQELRNQIVGLLTSVQRAIDRGADAVAWLEEAAREAQKE